MSINEINAEAKESLRKYFKNSQDVKHENEARKELTKEEILTQARNIKEYCINHTTNEEQCPFFNGYKTEGMLQIVICELNKGMCSPCNWDV